MIVKWFCKKCNKDYEKIFNLRAQQMNFKITKVQVECSNGHKATVTPEAEA